ncbi:hypothetical protein Tco_0710043 [Tanacetum coccineum]
MTRDHVMTRDLWEVMELLWMLSFLIRNQKQVRAKEMEAQDPFICNDSYESESSDNEEDAEDDVSQSGDEVTTDNDVKRDPFNLYDILNKRKDNGDDLKYPHGFTSSVINMLEVNKKVKGATSNEVNKLVNSILNKLEESVLKGKLSSNNNVFRRGFTQAV